MRKHPLLAVALTVAASAFAAERASPRDGWSFKFKDFVIGAWWGPGPTDAEVKLYREAGFNVVMAGRYMQLDDYGHADKGIRELDLAQKYGLGVMFDTYTKNDKPWGGKAGQGWSPPARGAWIETPNPLFEGMRYASPPARGAWIETFC